MNIAIIGVGLIGGSIALRLRKNAFGTRFIGIDTEAKHIEQALDLGIIDEAAVLEDGVKRASVIIIALPVDVTLRVLPVILDCVTKNQTVIDTGSTKQAIVNAVANHCNRDRFVAFHPMWGTENSGPAAATADSFVGKAAVVCDIEHSAPDALHQVEEIIKLLNMHPIYMSAESHDIHTAYISHISHITSYALANTVLEKEKEEDTIFQLASSGFSSTVRLAKSHPQMWVPIFKQNKENVLDVLNEHISQLRKFKSALEKENFDQVEELILKANKIRAILGQKTP